MDWIAPVVSASGNFLTGIVSQIGSTFSSLFVVATYNVDHFDYTPTDLALFVLSMVGIVVGYKVLRFTYGIVASLVHRDARA